MFLPHFITAALPPQSPVTTQPASPARHTLRMRTYFTHFLHFTSIKACNTHDFFYIIYKSFIYTPSIMVQVQVQVLSCASKCRHWRLKDYKNKHNCEDCSLFERKSPRRLNEGPLDLKSLKMYALGSYMRFPGDWVGQ